MDPTQAKARAAARVANAAGRPTEAYRLLLPLAEAGDHERLPRVRFTLRRLLLVIALLAVLMATGLELGRATRRAREYRQLAVAHAAFRDLSLGEADDYRYAYRHRTTADNRAGTDLLRSEAHERAMARYYDALFAKYLRAARFPWLPVEPDPPPPH